MLQSHNKTIREVLGREPVHPFPARMAPGIALEVIAASSDQLRILDPMVGSGTVIALARSNGHCAIGVDIDPLAVLISKVWTTTIDATEVREKAGQVLRRARHIFKDLTVGLAYPPGADVETRRFAAYWFDGYARRQLFSLSTAISRIHNDEIRDVLWCAFSRLIITKQAGASLAMDLSHSRPHKVFKYAPLKPFNKFLNAVDRVVENCVSPANDDCGPKPTIHQGDARILPIENKSVDLVVTSPPYLNAIDYMRCSKFSLIWMGHSIGNLRNLRSESVGSERSKDSLRDDLEIRNIVDELKLRPTLPARHEALLVRYIDDMRGALKEVARVLTNNGKAVYVIGENTVRGTYIPNAAIVIAVAELAGLKLRDHRTRNLPANRRYLPPPSAKGRSAQLNIRMRREAILAFAAKD